MTDIRSPRHKGRKSRRASRETPNLLRQMHLSESVFLCKNLCTARLFCSACWAAVRLSAAGLHGELGPKACLSLFSFYPQHTPEISTPSLFFWGRAQRNMPQTLNLGIVSLKANIWFRTAWIERNWWGLGVVRSESKLTPDCCKQLARTALKIKVHKAKWITEANFKKQRPYRRANPDLQRPRASWHRPNTLALSCLIQHYW